MSQDGVGHRTGLALARAFWADVVGPLLDRAAPSVPRAVARLGSGSDVLGLDDEMSRDHDWGLRLQVMVPADHQARVLAALEEHLPQTYAGLPTRLTFTGQSAAVLTVDVLSVEDLIDSRLGFDPRAAASAADWLSLTGQAVLEVTAGEVFEDGDGQLTALREALAWYPDDIWHYVVECAWQRLDQELPLMQRAGHRGDDLGSRVIAARLVDVAVHLGFLLCRRWAPYSKWRGTLFRDLPLPARTTTDLAEVLRAGDWRARGEHLASALEALAGQQRDVGLPASFPACIPFWDRPYLQVNPELLDIRGRVRRGSQDEDPGPGTAGANALPAGLGSIEQRTDNVDLLVVTGRRRAVVGCPSRPG